MGFAPGLLFAGLGLGLAGVLNLVVPAVPLLTWCVIVGLVVGQVPVVQRALAGPLAPGAGLAAKRLLRLGIVVLGLKLSLGDILGLGWLTLVCVLAVVVLTFFGTWMLGRLARLPGDQPLLIAAGFSICGVSAVSAVGAVKASRATELAVPIALVTLCGSLAIAVLPLLHVVLGFDDRQFGMWVGASVHDVGQVVAVAQTAGPVALAVAVAVKLSRVVLLAPLVAVLSVVERRRGAAAEGDDARAARPPIVPLFVLGFLAMMLVRTLLPVPEAVLAVADVVQTVLFGLALVAIGSTIRLASLALTGGRALAVGLASWVLVAGLAWSAVVVATA